jgi:hypothetical protein
LVERLGVYNHVRIQWRVYSYRDHVRSRYSHGKLLNFIS